MVAVYLFQTRQLFFWRGAGFCAHGILHVQCISCERYNISREREKQ